MKKFLTTVAIFAALILTSHIYFTISYKKEGAELLKRFKKDPNCEAFVVAFPKFNTPSKKMPKAVLLLHGYDSSPDFFRYLIPEFEKNNIPYYAPLLTGFGLTDYHLLKPVKDTDWVRDAVFSYNILSSIAENVIVIGHSNGGCDASILSSIKPIKTLILIDPYIYSNFQHEKALKILEPLLKTKVGNFLVKLIYPFSSNIFKKDGRTYDSSDLDPKTINKSFNYPLTPVASTYALLHEQKKAQYTLEKFKSSQAAFKPKQIYLLYGEKDITADMAKLVQYLKDYPIKHTIYAYPNSGHDLLVDFDAKKAVEQIMEIVKKS